MIKYKRDEREVDNKTVEYNLQLHAHNGRGFDEWLVLDDLPCDKRIVDFIKNGKGLISSKVFNGYIQIGKNQISQYLIFRCIGTHLNYSLKKLGKTFKLQKELLKTELNHDETYGDNWRNKTDDWVGYVKNEVLSTAFSYARYSKSMQQITRFGMKDCLSLPGFG